MRTFSSICSSLFQALLLPIAVLNLSCGVITTVWLLCTGNWSTWFQFLIYGSIAPSVLGVLTLVGAIPGIFGTRLVANRKTYRGYALIAIAKAWVYVLLFYSFVLATVAVHSKLQTHSLLLFLLCAYSIGVGPWGYLGSKMDVNTKGGEAIIGVLGLQIAAFTFGMLGWAFQTTGSTATAVYSSILVVAYVIETTLTISSLKDTAADNSVTFKESERSAS